MTASKRGKRGLVPQLVEKPLETQVIKSITKCQLKGCAYENREWDQHSHFEYGEYTFSVRRREKIELYDGPLFKWLDRDGKAANGVVQLQYDLPKNGKPGDWAEPDTKILATCEHGLHALLPGQRGFGGHGRLFVAEADGPVMFTAGKVVTSRLRLLREVDFSQVVTQEAKLAFWKKNRQILLGEIKYKSDGYRYHQYKHMKVQQRLRYLIKPSQARTLSAVRGAAKPLIKELRLIEDGINRYKQQEAYLLLGEKRPPAPPANLWGSYRRRTQLRAELRKLHAIAATAVLEPDWMQIPPEAITDNPDVALYLQKETDDPSYR